MGAPYKFGPAISLLAMSLLATPALARDYTVYVNGKSQPWLVSMNRKMPFGLNDGLPPKMVWANITPGLHVSFHASGKTATVVNSLPDLDPAGEGFCGSGRGGFSLFPSFYIDGKQGRGCLNTLIGAFVNADGTVVGKPFEIGEAADVVVPDGATAISLGLNDDKYSDNSGGLTVKIHISEANVTVEPVK